MKAKYLVLDARIASGELAHKKKKPTSRKEICAYLYAKYAGKQGTFSS